MDVKISNSAETSNFLACSTLGPEILQQPEQNEAKSLANREGRRTTGTVTLQQGGGEGALGVLVGLEPGPPAQP